MSTDVEETHNSRTFVIDVANVSKSYSTGADRKVHVLEDVSFGIDSGEVVAIVGASGSGKSTLLHILGALDRPDSGYVRYHDEDVFSRSDESLAAFRNRTIGFVFQFHHLLPEFSALENVAMPALIKGETLSGAQSRASELLELVGLAERLDHRPSMLSGGEQQRVAVARAMMNQPDVILADEPTGNLDAATASVLHEEIIRLSKTLGQTFVIATHNMSLAEKADRILQLQDKTLVQIQLP